MYTPVFSGVSSVRPNHGKYVLLDQTENPGASFYQFTSTPLRSLLNYNQLQDEKIHYSFGLNHCHILPKKMVSIVSNFNQPDQIEFYVG